MTWPITPAEVAAFGGIDRVNGNDALTDATAGAVAFVERRRPDLVTGQSGAAAFLTSPDIEQGAMMLAVNDYERRGSAKGAGDVDLYDRDRIDELLSIGKYAPFGFGAAS